jgi:protein-S-isoprenylcysteine O-methyltransferase Ste14
VRVPPFGAMLATAAAMWFAGRTWPDLARDFTGRATLAALLAVLGVVVAVAGVVEFRRARTTTNPLNARAASSLVTGGIYARTRNPMYLGFALALAGWAAWLGHPLAALGVAGFVAWMNAAQIPVEERALRDLFGAPFDEYCARVRRWI